MKKVGTQVELDLSSLLKEFDAAYKAVMQQHKGWQAWDAVVKKFFPTLKKATTALKENVGRLDELRHTQEEATEAGKAEVNTRAAIVKSLRRVIATYKESERALETLAKAEAKQAAEIQAAWAANTAAIAKDLDRKQRAAEKAALAIARAESIAADQVAKANEKTAQATQKAADRAAKAHAQRQRAAEQSAKKEAAAAKKVQQAQDRYSKSLGRSIKKMALWAVGSATAYRLFMKVRRAVEESIQEVYGHTEEMKGLTTAWDDFTHAVVVSLAPYNEMLDLMDRMAETLNDVSGTILETSTAWDGYVAVVEAAIPKTGLISGAMRGIIDEAGPGMKQFAGWLTVSAARVGILGDESARLILNTYDLAKAEREATNATAMAGAAADDAAKKMEGYGDAIDALRKRIDDYNKALYQITEQRFENMLQAQRDYNDGIVELELDRQRTIEDNAIEASRRLEDIQRDTARRMAAIEREYAKQIQASKKDYSKGMRRAAETLAEKLLDIERRYQDKLLDIERVYAHSMYDAISTRDATAALQAMRRRKEELADAKRDRDRARSDAHSDYAKRIRDLKESLAEQERLARQSYQDQLEALRRSLAEEEEDYQISLRRREEDAELSYTRSLSDLRQAFLDRLSAIQTQNTLERANARADYLLRENAYARHLARMAAIYQSYQTATTPSTPTFGSPPPPPVPFAQGGMMVVNQPTLAMFGEAGRELIIAQPLPAATQTHNIAGNVTHQINATISQSIAGMEGRIAGAVQQALAEVIH